MSLRCLVLAASHREASLNRQLAEIAAPHLQRQGHTVEMPAYATFDLPLFNDSDRERHRIPDALPAIAERLNAVDALLVVTPEYNWSYPGSLKNMIDWVSYLDPCPLAGKPALLMSASPSRRGGLMGLTHLKTVLESLEMHVLPSSFLLPEAHKAFDAQGMLLEAAQQTRLNMLLDQFIPFAQAIRSM